ncbi:MAG: amidohydrolase [Bacteroidia bacterium]|nr:amidohydrolase [Bacteroidia bacterium]
MRTHSLRRRTFLTISLILLSTGLILSQKKAEDNFLGKADFYKAKKSALGYLGDSLIVKKFGIISDAIWNYAELGMQEFKSSAILIKTLEEEGFNVEKGVAGMPTCFVASWGRGKPVIGILGEFDALPTLSQKALIPVQMPVVAGAPGHGCGHNMMGTAGIAAAIAVKKSMELNNIKGTIKFFGSPAEETLISRPYMVREGVFKDVDAVIDNHASSGLSTSYGVNGDAVMSVVFSFKGKAAHAAASPWTGRSALDGVELMDVATNYLREHLFYTYRLHYVITEGGEAPNVVPDRASVWYYIRNSDDRLEEMYKRVLDCAKGAALASGTTLDTVTVITAVHQRHSNKRMAETIQGNIELIGMPEWTEKEQVFAKALQKELGEKETGYTFKFEPLDQPPDVQVGGSSSDVGEVTLIAPAATLNFPGGVPGAIGHHWSSVASYYGTAAWKGLNTGAKVMAATALDLLTKPELLDEIKKEFAEYSESHPYKSFLPEGAKPPLNLNKELMEKYHDAMLQLGQDRK